MKRLTMVWIALAALVACGEQRIDGSSEEAMETSLEEVRESLSESERADFDEALEYLASEQISRAFEAAFAGGDLDADAFTEELGTLLDGRTASEVVETAREREREAALEEIEELREARAEAERAERELAQFEVSRARLTQRERSFGGTQPIIELSVYNGTEHAVSRAYFRGVVASPDRSVPWIDENFNHQIAGGLEPEESAEWNLSPNQFSSWGTVDVPPEAVLTVDVVRLDGPDGNALFDASDWTGGDAERLESLEEAWGEG